MNGNVLLTVDVEDWYQVENFRTCFPHSTWDSCECRVEASTRRVLELFDSMSPLIKDEFGKGVGIKATFFVLGWTAKKKPHLIREIRDMGHEIASHGYYHNMCPQCSISDLKEDLIASKKLLEDITGAEVFGYRAPSFSIDNRVLELLEECGYKYDSSFNSFSTNGRYGKIQMSRNETGIAARVAGSLYELPISNLRLNNLVIPVGGGGYFRLIPPSLFIRMAKWITGREKAFVFYFHPWEVDPGQPSVKDAPLSFRFRHYINLHRTEYRLKSLIESLKGYPFETCWSYLKKVTENIENSCFPGTR